jgi:phosphoribosyl 1,2-cyclic phosphodiesterase
MYQTRSTGGCILDAGTRVHIDPGPGALLRSRQEGQDPSRTRAVLVSHAHPDHYTDAEVAIEAMTRGGTTRRGMFVGSVSALDGTQSHDSVLSRFHRTRPEQAFAVQPGEHFKIGAVTVRATPSHHRDETTVGFRFTTSEGVIGYVADTAMEEDVVRAHKGSRVLVLPATRPLGKRIPWHLCTEDVAEVVRAIRPEVALLNHLGLKMIRSGPDAEARWIEDKTGVRTVAAADGMRATIGDTIEIGRMERVGQGPATGAATGPATGAQDTE